MPRCRQSGTRAGDRSPSAGPLPAEDRLHGGGDRAPRVVVDGEVIELGRGKRVRWLDTPHIPHGWDAGVLCQGTTGTLLRGDLFTQPGDGAAALHALAADYDRRLGDGGAAIARAA